MFPRDGAVDYHLRLDGQHSYAGMIKMRLPRQTMDPVILACSTDVVQRKAGAGRSLGSFEFAVADSPADPTGILNSKRAAPNPTWVRVRHSPSCRVVDVRRNQLG